MVTTVHTNATSGVYREYSPEQRRKVRSERLDEIWGEACGSKCPPLSQPSKSVCKIRVSFETPEARNSFCLEAYRPENEVASEIKDDVIELLQNPGIFRQASSLPPDGCNKLQRTDVPICRFAPARDVTTARRFSMGANLGAEEHRISVELNSRCHSAPNYGASLNVEKIWESRVPHKVVVNPFDNTPNTDGFFN